MKKEHFQNLKEIKAELKKGGTYFDTMLEAAKQAVIDAISRSAANVDIETAKSIGSDAAKQFLNHWIGGEDAEVPDLDPNNPLQRDVNGKPAKILHPSKEDDHEVPAFVAKLNGDVPAPPPGVPAALTEEEEAAQLHLTGTPDNVEVLKGINKKGEDAKEEGEKHALKATEKTDQPADKHKADKKK